VKVNVLKALLLGKADRVFFGRIERFVQQLHGHCLQFTQLDEFLTRHLVQCYDVPLQDDDQPALHACGIGMFDQPVTAFINGWAG
jgi:hypothetical protein